MIAPSDLTPARVGFPNWVVRFFVIPACAEIWLHRMYSGFCRSDGSIPKPPEKKRYRLRVIRYL